MSQEERLGEALGAGLDPRGDRFHWEGDGIRARRSDELGRQKLRLLLLLLLFFRLERVFFLCDMMFMDLEQLKFPC